MEEGRVSSGTVDAIEQALSDGKSISIEPVAKMMDKNDIDQVTIDKIETLLDNLSLQNKSQIEIVQYLDLSVVFEMNSQVLGNVSVLPEKTKWTVKIPQNLLSNQRMFHIIRVHNGNVELLPVTVQGNMISFQTDRFSTYAIAYEDKVTTQNFHTVTFVDMNNHILKTENVRHGEAATPPQVPYTKGYEFVKWDSDYHNIVENMTIKAIYKTMKSNDNPDYFKRNKETVETEDSTLSTVYLISFISSLFVLGYYIKTKNH